MKLLVATTVHTPLDARIHHRQIRALRAAGVEVTYLAPFGATGTPTTAVHPGVVAVDVPHAHGRHRLAGPRHIRRLLRRLGPDHDLILLHDPELVLAVRGQLRRLPPVVLDVHEDLPAAMADRDWVPAALHPVARRIASSLETYADRRLAGLLLAEDAYRDRFGDGHAVVPNLPWVPADPPPAGCVNRVVHVGRLSEGRGVRELLALAERLAARPGGPELVLVGSADRDVAPAVQRAADRGQLRWTGYLPNDDALAQVDGAVAGLAILHDLPNYRRSLPTKVVEYLAHRVPAVVTPLPVATDLARRSGGGIEVPFGDVDALERVVRDLAADPARARALGDAGRRFVLAEASWDLAATRFVTELHRLAGQPIPVIDLNDGQPLSCG